MGLYIGIDIGTSSAKITAIDTAGKIVSGCDREYQYSEPQPGWKEIWPKVWVEAVKSGLKALLSDLDRHSVEAIGITGQMHTTVFLDENGCCIRPAIMWNDMRTKDDVSNVKGILTQEDTASILKIISTGSPAMNLLWLKNNEPENFKKLHKFLIGPDYLVYYFTGKYSTDYCEASTSSLYDLEERCWSESMRKIIGLHESAYPPVKGSQEIVGSLRSDLQEELGLPFGVKMIAGTGDNSASAIATGCLRYQYPVLSIGTSGVLMVSRNKIDKSMKGKRILFSLDGKEINNLIQGVVQSAGGSYGWYVKKVLGVNNFNDMTDSIDTSKLGENNLLFYPHLTGDKTVYSDPTLRGAFIGLDTNHTREDLAIAVMEGVCFAVKQLSEAMQLSEEELHQLKVTGGGANSEVWMQILSDVLNVEIVQLDSSEGAAYGAAIMACNAVNGNNKKEELQGAAEFKNSIVPRPHHVDLYAGKYHKYLRIYDAVKMIYQ
ncbi:MAG: xylulokinase [Lacrimispora sp.]|uniref:xylulokinase n=1 Tax=Lacrimispora sp. TaxID=2719234 RepID=UPI0039E71198